jgi:hypothetical protein
MAEACLVAYVEVEGGVPADIPESLRNRYAGLLAKRLTLYSMSEDRERIRRLEGRDMRMALFRDGGREIAFLDEREPIGNLVVKRTALKAAIEILKRAKSER